MLIKPIIDQNRKLVGMIACLLVITIVIATVGITYAYMTDTAMSEKVVDVGNSDVTVIEDRSIPSVLLPGLNCDEKISVENSGKNELAIRARVDVSNPDMYKYLTFAYNSEAWTYDNTDGYYYYKDTVPAGEETAILFNEFEIQKTSNGVTLTKNDMENFEILIYAEGKPCSQASQIQNVFE